MKINKKDKATIRMIISIKVFLILVFFFFVPIIQPEFTIQCVPDDICVIDNITLYERYLT